MSQTSDTIPTATSTPVAAPETAIGRWTARMALLLVLSAYSFFLYSNFAPAISTPDSDGYWAQASLIATAGKTWFVPEADTQYIGMHWLITPEGKYISRYPPGLPVVVAAVYKLGGYKAAVLVDPVLAVLTLVGFYLLVRHLTSRWWALAAVLLLISLPVVTQFALASESHMSVTFCLVWGTYLLLRWARWPVGEAGPDLHQNPGLGKRVPLALLAGLLLGMIPTVRYPEALLALGIGAFVLSQARRYPRISIDYAALLLGAAIPITALLVRNQSVLGAFWRTGYSLTNEQTGFSWFYFKAHFFQYIRAIQSDGLGLVFALGIAGIVWMCAVRRVRALGIMLLLESAAMICLYMAYYWAPQGGNMTMRFLLPLFPGFILAGVWMLATATAHAPRLARVAVPFALVTIQLLWGGETGWSAARMLHYQQDLLARVTDSLEHTAGHGDVVIAGPAIQQHLDFVRHWKLVDLSPDRLPGMIGRMPGWAMSISTPMPMQREKFVQRQQRYADMDDDERQRSIASDIRKWAGDRPIYFVGTVAEMQQASSLLLGEGKFQVVTRVSLPERPQMNTMAGPIWVTGGIAGGMQPPPGGPVGGPPPDGLAGPGGPGGPPGRPGAPPGMVPRQGGGMVPWMGGRGGPSRGPFRPGGGMFGGGSLAGQHEAIIARWVPAATPTSAPAQP